MHSTASLVKDNFKITSWKIAASEVLCSARQMRSVLECLAK